MIKNVKLKNWRSHSDSNIEFSSGTNVLTGVLGAGKSSIMDAISFALFGTFPTLQTKKVKLDDTIMSKPFVKKDAKVSLTFSYEGKDYTVTRLIEKGRGTTYSELREGDKLLDSPNSQRVTETIQKLLKIDYELFSKAIYSEQNALDYFLRLSRGERMKKIDNLLRIDKFEQARSSTVTLRNRINERKLDKQNIVEQINIKEIEKNIFDIDTSLREYDEEISSIKEDYENSERVILFLEKRIKEMESKEKQLASLNQQKRFLQTNIEEYTETIKEIKNILKNKTLQEIKEKLSKANKEFDEIEKKFDEKRDENEKLLTELSKYKTELSLLRQEKNKLEKAIKEKESKITRLNEISKKYGDDIEKDLKNKKKLFEKINSEISVLEFDLNEKEKSIEQIEKLENKCPVCDSYIDEDKKKHLIHIRESYIETTKRKIEKNNLEKQRLSSEIEQLENAASEAKYLKKDIEDFEKIKKELGDIEKSLVDLSSKEIKLNKNFETSKEELNELQKRLKILTLEKNESNLLISKASELEEKEMKLVSLKDKLKEIEDEIWKTEKDFEIEEFEKIKDQYKKSISKYSELKTRIEERERTIREMKKRRDELKERMDFVRKQKEEIMKLENLLKNLKIFEIALEKTQIQLREEFVDTVNHKMNEIWADIYPYSDYIGIRLSIDEGDYTLQLSDKSGEWFDIERVSGGERSIACLTLRIAFSLVLVPQLNWLILDEPTHNLDAKAIENLSETLRDRIGDFVEQIFIITHDKALENAATGEIYRIHRDKEADDITRIERVTEI